MIPGTIGICSLCHSLPARMQAQDAGHLTGIPSYCSLNLSARPAADIRSSQAQIAGITSCCRLRPVPCLLLGFMSASLR